MKLPTPIYKVGLVLYRMGAANMPEILIIRPHPKTPGEKPKFVLPRGSRQYQDETGNWHDARDAATAHAHAATLEPLTRALAREAEEEAGLTAEFFTVLQRQHRFDELGTRVFASRSKPPYPIHWFVARLSATEAKRLTHPADASEVRWISLREIETLAEQGDFSPGYVPVIEEALALHTSPYPPR